MNEDRWTKIEQLVERALELPPEDRAAFIENQCGTDEALRNEIQSLLEHGEKALSFMGHFEEDVVAPSIDMMAQDQLDEGHRIDTQFGHYHITDILGRGGMGIVYKAKDTNLDRTVALKFLPTHLTRSNKDKQRFIREAKAAAALNHSNICTIYSVEEHEGQHFISMEYIDGQTLRETLESEDLPPEKGLEYAIHIAEALAEAHEKGVVHRDIKPGNIMVDSKDRIKVMDFGLAKLVDSTPITQTGTTLGTMAYMSPEQIQGRPVDHRADLFSFGVLLFEMLTGQRPFGGQYEAALSYSIVNEEPPLLSEFLPNAPQKLSRLVSRLLEKDPAKRFSDSERLAGDLKGCLDQLPDSIETSKVTQSTTAQTQTGESFSSDSTSITINFPTLRSRNGILSLAGIVIVLALIGYWLLPSSGSPLSPTNNKIAVLPLESISTGPEDVQFTDGVHEELINRLAGISDLTVIARRSVLGFTPDERQDLQSIAEQLGVSVLMDGTVRRIGDQLRVSVQLIDVNNLGTLWSGSFEENIDNVFEIQSRIARQVANELQASLTEDEEQRLDDRPTDNPQAYQLYMQAREYLSRSRNEKNNLLFAEQLFKQALGEDRGFAQAWAMLAVTYSDLYWIHDHDPDQLEQMGEAAEWAFFHEPELFETYLAMGIYRYWSHSDNEQTLTFLKKTLQRFPNQPLLHRYLGVTNRRLGNWNQVEYHLNKAIEQDPRNVNHYNEIAFFYYLIREYDQALEMINRSIDLWDDTNTVSSAIKSWIVLERSGSLEGFETWFDQITSRDPIEVIPYFWGDYNYLKHDWEEAFRAFMNIESDVAHSHDVHHYPTAYLIALTLDSQGERVSALEKYEQVREHLEILLDKYPEDPRYRARLGNVYARIGEVKKAIQEGEKATELVPETQDAYLGAYFEMDLAMIYAWIDRKEQAIDKLEYLLSVPSMVHKNRLRIDPSWKPLWDHPRFQELIAGEDEPYLEGL